MMQALPSWGYSSAQEEGSVEYAAALVSVVELALPQSVYSPTQTKVCLSAFVELTLSSLFIVPHKLKSVSQPL